MYSREEKSKLAEQMRSRLIQGTAEGHEVALTLILLAETGEITFNDVKKILSYAHFGNTKGVVKSLKIANEFIRLGVIEDVKERNK